MMNKVNELLNSLNFEGGQDSRYYIDKLKSLGIKINSECIEVKAARYHVAKYGKMNFNTLLYLTNKYNLDKHALIEDTQEEVSKIYLKELMEELNK